MKRATLVLSAAALDWIIGDPESLPHPVRLMGWTITRAERMLRRECHAPAQQIAAGALLTILVAGGAYSLTRALLSVAYRTNNSLGGIIELWLANTCLAARNLDDEAQSVLDAFAAGDLVRARLRLSRIVGRDTALLDEHGIARALIETIAESLCDGFVAPLFYLALGGVPMAMLFKSISTMDSMIGHREERYLYFGRVAARLDDAANLVPARLTALALLAVCPSRARLASMLWRRDAHKHASPNAGHPEAAMAGVLGVELGGASSYAGEIIASPRLNAWAPLPTMENAYRALSLMRGAAALAVVTAFALCWSAQRRRCS
jgi:adenosylcobinamide-phosphate synthase